MFYRVSYVVTCLVLGLIVGVTLGERLRGFAPARIAIAFYNTVTVLLVTILLATSGSMLGYTAGFLIWISGISGGLSNLCLGALFGIAARQRSFVLLQQPQVMQVLRIVVAFTFAVAAIGKAFSFNAMTDFFAQSG